MNKEIKKIVIRDFKESDQAIAISELESITPKHVMAESQQNLDNTQRAILKLSHGSLSELRSLVKTAKQDFRDVIYWASLE